MTLNDLLPGEPWMDPEERQTAADVVQSIQQSLADRQIPEAPFLILRVQDYLLHHTLCRRLERSLAQNPAMETPADVLPKLAEQIGKSRDRLRRSLKELDDAAAKLAPPSDKKPAKGTPSNAVQTANPLHDYEFCQELIKEVGIDLNDPDFFSDELNFHDLPLKEQQRYRRVTPEPGNASMETGDTAPHPDAPESSPSKTPAKAAEPAGNSEAEDPPLQSETHDSLSSDAHTAPVPAPLPTPSPVITMPPILPAKPAKSPVPFNYTPPPPYMNRDRRKW